VLASLMNLKELSLSRNQFTGNFFHSLYSKIVFELVLEGNFDLLLASLTKVEVLNLSGNKFSGKSFSML
jgi:hypothetical protein